MTDADVQTLVPTARSAASRQTERTSTLRPAIRAVPYAWVASNALAYVRPCRARMPKALPPRISTAGRENTATTTATSRVAGRVNTPESATSSRVVTTNNSGITIASAPPIASTGSPLDFRSNHTCARVADVVGHGNRNRPASQSENPRHSTVRGMAARASPRRCRATPATVRPNDATPIDASSA